MCVITCIYTRVCYAGVYVRLQARAYVYAGYYAGIWGMRVYGYMDVWIYGCMGMLVCVDTSICVCAAQVRA